MSAKVRVPLYGKTQGQVTIERDATNGATVGVNLFWSDGTLVTAADFNPEPADDAPEVSKTLWRLILEVPPNVKALENATGTGLFAITGTGTGATREIANSDDLEWTDPDGVAGNPTGVLTDTAVTPGTYTNATVTVDQKGRVTFAESGTGSAVPYEVADGTVYAVPAGYQALFTIPIDLLGTGSIDLSGALVEVA